MTEITVGKETLLVPESGSPCDLWKTYFSKLKTMVGRENAKMISGYLEQQWFDQLHHQCRLQQLVAPQ